MDVYPQVRRLCQLKPRNFERVSNWRQADINTDHLLRSYFLAVSPRLEQKLDELFSWNGISNYMMGNEQIVERVLMGQSDTEILVKVYDGFVFPKLLKLTEVLASSTPLDAMYNIRVHVWPLLKRFCTSNEFVFRVRHLGEFHIRNYFCVSAGEDLSKKQCASCKMSVESSPQSIIFAKKCRHYYHVTCLAELLRDDESHRCRRCKRHMA